MLICFVSRCVFPLCPSHPHPPSGFSPGVEAERGSAIFTSLISHLSLSLPSLTLLLGVRNMRHGWVWRERPEFCMHTHTNAFSPLSAFDSNLWMYSGVSQLLWETSVINCSLFFLSETLFLSFNHHLLRFLFIVLACVDFSILVLSLSLLLYVPFHSPSPLLCVCRCSFCSRSLACLSECECWLLACLSVWLTAPALRRNAWFCQCLSARPYLQNLILTASTVSVASLPPSRFPSSYFILPFPPFSINVLPSSVFRDWHCISSCLFKILQKCLICDCDV